MLQSITLIWETNPLDWFSWEATRNTKKWSGQIVASQGIIVHDREEEWHDQIKKEKQLSGREYTPSLNKMGDYATPCSTIVMSWTLTLHGVPGWLSLLTTRTPVASIRSIAILASMFLTFLFRSYFEIDPGWPLCDLGINNSMQYAQKLFLLNLWRHMETVGISC